MADNSNDYSQVDKNYADENNEDSLEYVIQQLVVIYNNVKILVKRYLILLAVLFLCGLAYAAYAIFNKETNYQAAVVFILQEDVESQSTTNLDPLSSYFLSRSTSQAINLEKLDEITFSQRLLTNLMFNKCIVSGKEDYLINHILSVYYNHTSSYFTSFRGLNGLNRNEYRVFNNVVNLVRKSTSVSQKKSGAFVITLELKNEELTKVTSELLYQNLSNFYIDKTTEKAQSNYVFLRNRLDSVRNMLYSSEYQVANFEDRARNLLLQTARVPQARQIRNTQFYQTLYGELISSFERSKVTLNNITPVFQILSRPYYPLLVVTQSSRTILLVVMAVTFVIILLLIALLYMKEFLWPKYKPLFKTDEEITGEVDEDDWEEDDENQQQ